MNFLSRYSRTELATAIALLFHGIGLTGILFFNRAYFIQLTPLNLLLSAALVLYTAWPLSARPLLLFIALAFAGGFAAEWIGVNTGWLFGNYQYGTSLGIKWQGVPWLIGLNWFVVLYCCGTTMHLLIQSIQERFGAPGSIPEKLSTYSVVIDGASLAVLFDWIMEPVAVKLGYWTWLGDGSIPLLNYGSWFAISVLLLFGFHLIPVPARSNKFGLNLLLIQGMFFLILRSFL